MADWYVSSVAYAAVVQWAATTTYAVGDIRRQLAAQTYPNERCFRVSAITTGISGGSEPSWNRTNSATTTDGGVTWTECTGQSNHQHDNGVTNTWTAPASYFEVLDSAGKNILAAGDRIFASSDHNETAAPTARAFIKAGTVASPVKAISVNRTSANIPPLSADITIGASISCTVSAGTFYTGQNSVIWKGFTFSVGASGSGSAIIYLVNTNEGIVRFEDCTFVIVGTGTSGGLYTLNSSFVCRSQIEMHNCTFNFGSTSHAIWLSGLNNLIIKGSMSFTGSVPATLIKDGSAGVVKGTIRMNGCDLNSISGTLFANIALLGDVRLINCGLNGSVTVVNTAGDANSLFSSQGTIELINCDSSNTNYKDSWYNYNGSTVTETTITRTNGAVRNGTKISRKMVSAATHVGVNNPLMHVLWINNATTGSSVTATVEFISSGTLTNAEIWGEVEYPGSAVSVVSSFGDDTIADLLEAAANQTSSSATWDSSPATPVTQKLQIAFTPQKAGLVKFVVKLAKASTTVYVDPDPVLS